MSDSTHCQLLYSLLSSNAFLNMHALHFPTTFQMKMDVPYARSFSLLPPLSSCLCSLQLRFICGWPNFQVCSILRCRGRLKDTWATWHGFLCGAHYCAHPPLLENEPITLRLFVPIPGPFLCLYGSRCTHARRQAQTMSPAPPCHNVLLKEMWSLLQVELLSIYKNDTSPTL